MTTEQLADLLEERNHGPDAKDAAAMLRAQAAEIEALRTAIERACKGYPDDATAPTCVAILRAALKEKTP